MNARPLWSPYHSRIEATLMAHCCHFAILGSALGCTQRVTRSRSPNLVQAKINMPQHGHRPTDHFHRAVLVGRAGVALFGRAMVFLTLEIATYAASLLTIATILVIICKRIFIPSRRLAPPSLFRWPIIGNASILLSKEPHKTFLQITKRLGPIFTIAIGPVDILCLTKYKVIKEALVRQGDIFAGRPRFHALSVSERGYNGIVLVDGQGWKVHRRFSLQTLKEFGVGRTVMEDKILSEADHLRRVLTEYAQNGRSVDVSSLIEVCVSNVLASLIFGKTFKHDDAEFRYFLRAVDESFKIAVSFGAGVWERIPWVTNIPVISRWIGFDRMIEIDKIISTFLRNRMRECEEKWVSEGEQEVQDVTTAFLKEMRQRQSDPSDSQDLFNDRQWLALINDLWVAGIETTMVALNWVVFYLCHFPHVQTGVQQEIDWVIGRERQASMSDRSSMPYTQAVLCECLRFANMIPFNIPHKVQRDTQLGGYHIQAGTWVLAQICTVLWDPEIFPNPDQFEPERFLDENGRMKTIEEFIPFSIGKRSCLGESLAKAEMFLIVAQLLQVFTFRFNPQEPTPSKQGIMGLTKKPPPYQCLLTFR